MKESRKIAEGLAPLETVIFLESEGMQCPLVCLLLLLAIEEMPVFFLILSCVLYKKEVIRGAGHYRWGSINSVEYVDGF